MNEWMFVCVSKLLIAFLEFSRFSTRIVSNELHNLFLLSFCINKSHNSHFLLHLPHFLALLRLLFIYGRILSIFTIFLIKSLNMVNSFLFFCLCLCLDTNIILSSCI